MRFAREKDISLFMELSHSPPPAKPADVPLGSLVPAYVLERAQDFVSNRRGVVPAVPDHRPGGRVHNLSVGMVQLPPVMVSAPFKILLFVLVDGWNLVIGSLVRGLLLSHEHLAVVALMRNAFLTTFWLSLPLLAVGFVIGIFMSLAQIITSIQDSSFSTVPRLGAFLAALLLAMPWMLTRLIAYTAALFGDLGRFAH